MSAVGELVESKLSALVTCLVNQIEADDIEGTPELCFVGRLPGDGAVADYAGYGCEDGTCGMAWVRLVALYPANGLGTPDQRAGNCGSTIGLDVEIGILRCVTISGEDGSPPEAEEMKEVSATTTNDAMTMWRAVACCSDFGGPKDFRMSAYNPVGPLGGLLGGTYVVQLVL